MDQLDQFIETMLGKEVSTDWVVQAFVVIFSTLLLNYFLRKFFKRLDIQAKKTKNLWDDSLLAAGRKPVRYFVLLIGARVLLKITEKQLPPQLQESVPSIFSVFFIALIAWAVIRFITEAEKNLRTPGYTKEPMDETTVSAIAKLLRLSVIITGGLVILQTLGYSVSGVLAFGGVGGIAVGFAAKDLLANFFGGMMIYMDRPFSVGDWVRSPDRKIEGTVEHIGWRLTLIRTFDKRPLYVPNSMFTSISLENPSRMTHRRIYETMGVRYDDVAQLPSIVAKVKQMLIDHEEIDSTQTMIVNFNSYAASSLDFFIYTFTKTTNWVKFHEVKQDVLFLIAKIIEEHGAEFAFPTQTLHLEGDVPPAGLEHS
ncbi:MAG: mechanosensitive ion channel protein MscS [Moraxellaceae bacterium]|nr:MAG: mechanosensitive ion channel protein MscS [Moraxellaceae bacterium]